MLNLTLNGARVSYDSLDEAKDAARESGLGLAFWRETLSGCAENEAMWNEFLNDLWQSGAEDEAERLDRTFPKDAPRHWLLVALTLDGDDPWEAFLAEWDAQGDERILAVVSSPAFTTWLKQVQPARLDILNDLFGSDLSRWKHQYLVKVVLRMNNDEISDPSPDSPVRSFVRHVLNAFGNAPRYGKALADFIHDESAEFLKVSGREEECAEWDRISNSNSREFQHEMLRQALAARLKETK